MIRNELYLLMGNKPLTIPQGLYHSAYWKSRYATVIKNRKHISFADSSYFNVLRQMLSCLLREELIVYPLNAASSFDRALSSFFQQNKIPSLGVQIKNNRDVWLRDQFFDSKNDINNKYNKVYVRNKVEILDTHNRINSRKHRRHRENPKFSIERNMLVSTRFYNPTEKDYQKDCSKGRLNMLDNKDNVCFPNHNAQHYKSTCRTLEGGNLFDVYNQYGERYVLIGETTVAYEAWFAYSKKRWIARRDRREFNGDALKDEEKRANMVTQRYAKIFGVSQDRVLIIPNICYHLDLQMGYIGLGIFIINSFDETLKHFPMQKQAIPDNLLLKAKERQVDNIQQLLTKNGFLVHKVCATLYRKPWDDDYSGERNASIWGGGGLISSFINGFHVCSRTPYQDYFVTVDSPHNEHKKYFTKQLALFMITPHFVTINNCSVAATIALVGELGGGVRCQTNSIRQERNLQPKGKDERKDDG